MTRRFAAGVLALAFLVAAAPAGAVSLADGKLNINGYGNWHYVRSDGNS